MNDRQKDLCKYRISQSKDSLEVAEIQVKPAKMVMEEIIKFIQCVGVGDL